MANFDYALTLKKSLGTSFLLYAYSRTTRVDKEDQIGDIVEK